MSDDGRDDGIGPEAYAAFDGRKMTAHEIGTWPAYRDGYAAGMAAREPGPDVARLLAAAKELDEFQRYYAERACDDMPGNDLYRPWLMRIVEHVRAAVAEHEAAAGGGVR